MAMEEFKSKYNLFYDQLLGFVSDLVTKLKPDAPSELQYVTIIPDILSMDDPDLQLANEDGVVKKAYIVVQLTELVAERAKQYVDDEDWFDEKANMVKLYLTLVTLNLATLRLSEDESPYHLEAGLGGINTGAVPTHREINVDNLKALFHVLANSAVQQSAS